MILAPLTVSLCVGLLAAAAPAFDLAEYRAQPGLEAVAEGDELSVRWEGERGRPLRARFAIVAGTPTVRELAVGKGGGGWLVLGRDLVPEFRVTSGVRRTGHGLDHEHRWDVFWDAPLNHPEEVRRASATFSADRGMVRTNGARLEVSFPGLTMGIFSGRVQFTVYRGTNLVRVEAIAWTDEPSVAYIYEGGLRGFTADRLPRVSWLDAHKGARSAKTATASARQPAVLRARHRVAVAGGGEGGGSIAVFPTPHQFFFAREIEVNLGYVWYRGDAPGTFALGVRQGESAEGYNPTWINQVFSLYNAPPGTWQRMAVYFAVSPDDAEACRASVMAYTRGDRYKPLPGYKTMVTHFHTAFAAELEQSGSLDTTPPWIPMMRALGINIAHIFDFHGDGHPRDPGPIRVKELATYFEGCRRHSDRDFMILPGEEANVYLGGHYNIVFPRPVYWTHVRGKDQPFVEDDPKHGKVYHVGSAADLVELIDREDGLVWQTHPRTKGSTGYPDKIRGADYFRGPHWLGAAFKALPVDLSQQRLGEVRCFGTLDDMNNWGRAKYMIGEVDTYKKYPDYDLYGEFNVNYVWLDRLPTGDDWSPILRALRAGNFFVTTGEVLIPRCIIKGQGKAWQVEADVEWTFPLEFVEVVWGDGQRVDRMIVPATELGPFGTHRFRLPFDVAGTKWVRFAVWDSAGNGAFTQPVHLE